MKINSMLQYFVIGFFIYIFWRKKMTVYNEYESCLQNNNDTDKLFYYFIIEEINSTKTNLYVSFLILIFSLLINLQL